MRTANLALCLTLLALTSCTTARQRAPVPVPIAHGAAVCETAMAACEKRCAECPDKQACLSQGGECAAGTYFNDTGDIGPDIWTPGCHYQYSDPQCSTGKAFFDGDICSDDNPKLIIEWTLSDCHPPQGDTATYNCDVECLRAGRGNGTCVPLPTACSGKRSAYCKCDRPGPTG